MASERAEFIANMNLEQVDAALRKTRANIDQSVGGAAASAFNKFDSASNKAVKAVGALGFAMGSMGNVTRGALKDVGDVAMILGSGGALGIALTGTAVLIGHAIDKWDLFGAKAKEAAGKAAAELEKTREQIRDLDTALEALVTGRAAGEIEQRRKVVALEAAARVAIDAAGGAEAFARLLRYEEEGIDITMAQKRAMDSAIAATKAYALEQEKMAKTIRNRQMEELKEKDVEKDRPIVPVDRSGAMAAAVERVRSLVEKENDERANTHQKAIDEWMKEEIRFRDMERAQEEKAAAENLRIWRERDDARIALAKKTADTLSRLREMEAEKELAERKAQADAIADIVSDTAAMAGEFAAESLIAQQKADKLAAESAAALAESKRLAAAGLLTESRAAQAESDKLEAESVAAREAALVELIAAASHAAGGMIMLTGGEIIAKGVAELLATGGASPLGWAQTIGGAGLVAAGAAIQTGGPEAVGALLGMGGAGSAAAATDRGAPLPRRSGGRRGSGGEAGAGITIVNQWGVAGPTADDQARAMSRVLDRVRDGRFS